MSATTLPFLVARLKACPSRDDRLTEKLLQETWKSLRQTDLEQGDELTPAILAALVLQGDEPFAGLLNEAERSQLSALAQTAFDRCEQQTHPPNKLGRLLAGSIHKE